MTRLVLSDEDYAAVRRVILRQQSMVRESFPGYGAMNRLWCLFAGHVYTRWQRFVWATDTPSWEPIQVVWTTNGTTESRFCARCHGGYQQRWAS